MSISNRKPGDKKEAPTEPLKRSIVAEFYQRCFGVELPESSVNVALS